MSAAPFPITPPKYEYQVKKGEKAELGASTGACIFRAVGGCASLGGMPAAHLPSLLVCPGVSCQTLALLVT